MVKKINSSEFGQVKNNKAIIVDFSAEWCGPCKMLAPVMEQLSDEITDVEFTILMWTRILIWQESIV